jgi:iron complex outermembrane receptor protein
MVLLSFAINTKAQNKDTVLKEVRVRARHKASNDLRINEFSPGQKIVSIDSATLQQYQLQNMANLLSQQEPVFVKSYGMNGLATLNFRGSSAAQSQVMWNGIPIQNAALGLADVASLPVMLMSKVNIVYGGSAALLGSGNVGGALLLEDDAPVFRSTDNTHLSFNLGGGSFTQLMGGFRASTSSTRWYFSASGFRQFGADNFRFTTAQGAHMLMAHDTMHGTSALVRAAYRIADKNVVSLSAWYQQDSRDIPPALFETYSDKQQTDRSLRLLLDWSKQTASSTWYAKSSLIRDEVVYRYEAVQLHTDDIVYQYYQEAGWKKQFGSYGQLLVFIPLQIAWLNLPDSNKTKQQDKIALAGAYDYKHFDDRLDIAINARAEQINGQGNINTKQLVFLPGANASFVILDWLTVRANAQRTYRAPTLNELYFNPGGNAALKPEQGWSEDAGYTVKVKAGNFTLYHDLSVFNRDIHDWILWLGGAIWTPHNIAEVHSRGMETENNLTYATGKWKFHLGVNTAYVLATTVSSYIYNDGSVGKQIPYTPRYNGQLNVGFSYRRFSFNYNHTYTGYRFTTTDESSYLLPYQTGNVQLIYSMPVRGHLWQLTGLCNNIWNEQYQVVASRPMPGINWLAGLKINLF